MADFLRGLFGGKPKRVQPPTIDTDEILPVHFFDGTDILSALFLSWTLRFNDVLDADKLSDALAKLVEIDSWRKLGGRVRKNKEGKLELHVPRTFTPERPAIRYTHIAIDLSIDEHPLGSQLPQATEIPSLQAGAGTFRSFAIHPNSAASFEDLLYSDEPQLSLHITSFSDATLVSLAWTHIMTDAMGRVALVTAWSNMLAGRKDKIPPLMGIRSDPLATVGTAADKQQEPFVLAEKRLTGFKMLIFGLRFLWDMLWRPNIESRMLFLPSKYVARLHQHARDNLLEDTKAGEPPFVSEGDVLTAWATRLIALSRSPRPVTVMSALDVRSRLKSLFKPGETYIQNIAFGTYTLLSSYEAITLPLGHVAAKFRQSIVEQTTEPQVRLMIGMARAAEETGGPPPIFGEPSGLLVIFSNWSKCKFLQIIDFSPAVIRSGKKSEKRSNPPGTPIYMHSQPMVQSRSTRNVFNILGKDHDGNYWITGFLLPESWAKIEQHMKQL